MILFYKSYFRWALILLAAEILIAVYLHDAIIRPYGGDFLAVILLYCAVKSFSDANPVKVGIGVLLFAYAIEISQYFHLVNLLGLQRSNMARLLLGTSFSLTDMLTYTLGIALVIVIEKIRTTAKSS
ncbi:MAG TPA: DUF2809 domain-containing protein [Mucilaginibacter sp.]|nr:DUF2809 domain-containing protein [Mucilaginibacter sp.]